LTTINQPWSIGRLCRRALVRLISAEHGDERAVEAESS
jgi:hypothetical protein